MEAVARQGHAAALGIERRVFPRDSHRLAHRNHPRANRLRAIPIGLAQAGMHLEPVAAVIFKGRMRAVKLIGPRFVHHDFRRRRERAGVVRQLLNEREIRFGLAAEMAGLLHGHIIPLFIHQRRAHRRAADVFVVHEVIIRRFPAPDVFHVPLQRAAADVQVPQLKRLPARGGHLARPRLRIHGEAVPD